MEVQFLIFFLNLGEKKSDKNDDSNFEILLHFEAAIAAELFYQNKIKFLNLEYFDILLTFTTKVLPRLLVQQIIPSVFTQGKYFP